MGQTANLIDTNVVIDYLGGKLPSLAIDFLNPIINDIPQISIITKIELLGFDSPKKHYTTLYDFVEDATVHSLTEDIANMTITIRKKYKTKLPDAIIAATALVENLTLVTRNTSDFKNIDNLKVKNPYDL